MNITIIGTGYVGLVTGACLANLGHSIRCGDIDSHKISLLEKGDIPFYEPGLKELVLQNKEKGRLTFSTNIPEAIAFGEVIFNCVGTPGKEDGSADLQYVFSVAENVGKFAQGYKLLINKSTVPPGTARQCHLLIKKINPHSEVEVVSNPEFLAEGKAVYDFTHPDKIVVGAQTSKAFSIVRKIYTGRVRMYIPVVETDWETAEMIKYANNSFLSTKISFINEIANICDTIGADVRIVAQALGMDYRINPKFFQAGIGYGGSCFPKDVRALYHVAREKGYDARLLREVDALNTRQRSILLQKMDQRWKTIEGKTLTIWGLSFKPKTSDIREAPALTIISELLKRKATIKVMDPIAMPEVKALFGDQITYCHNIHDSVQNSSAIILLTEWDEFRNVHFSDLGKQMEEKVMFDGRNIYEPELMKDEGFEYYGVGRR
ncbi:MAG TPA: UDP-glucose/GDP-mannose dehydrogenase family protein [Candidatus Nanoarchaeia archaeon]|nr:UDP-glucose/GDP-mannose dehydrogenase family protein [Candidatus Nanoarchaeia archaeon]